MKTLYKDDYGRSQKTRTLIECAIMLALATVLSLVQVYKLPTGGSITACSCVPLMLVAYKHKTGYGVFTAFNFSIIQLLLGLSNLSYCRSPKAALACVILDYILAYTVLGFCAKLSQNPIRGVTEAMAIRFVCHLLSGVYVWSEYWDSWASWSYSIVYNGSYMLVETIITVIATKLILDRI